MKLYYAPGACSLATHIAVREAGLPVELVRVNLTTHTLPDGSDYYGVSPRGYVPLLELDDGSRHSEVAALLQYLADQDPQHSLLPAHGTPGRLPALSWLTFVSSELHKGFGWLWAKDAHESVHAASKTRLAGRFAELDALLAGQDYLLASGFSVVDAYAFTVINWSNFLGISLAAYPALQAWMGRVAGRPAVQAALRAEGLLK